MVTADELEVAWAAGFIDGEGYSSISKNKKPKGLRSPRYKICVGVTHTKLEPLYRLQAIFGGSVLPRSSPKRSKKKVYRWLIYSHKCARCLEAILPFLSVKAEQTRLCLQLHRLIQSSRMKRRFSPKPLEETEVQARELIYQRIRILNMRGKKGELQYLQLELEV